MKLAKLPNGKTLKFPDHTPDDAIDATVKAHLQDHIAKINQEKQDKEAVDIRHNQLVEMLGMLIQLIGQQTQVIAHLAQDHAAATQQAGINHASLERAIKSPRTAVFENGRIVGSKVNETTH